MVESEDVYTYFTVNVYDSAATPTDVKFNFDIDSNVYVTFNCDCGTKDHIYSIDGAAFKGCNSPEKLSLFTRTVDHTLTVKCNTCGTKTDYSYARVNEEGLEYMGERITAVGESQDLYVDSLEEMAFMLKYLAYGGDEIEVDEDHPYGKSSITVYVSNAFLEYIKTDEEYFSKALNMSGVTGISCSLSGKGNIFTLTAGFGTQPNSEAKAGTAKVAITDGRGFLVAGTRSVGYSSFPIVDSAVSETITLESELDDLPYGVKPVFASDCQAKTVYLNALNVCRTYISDDMSDVEKLLTIYHWLAVNVTYDTNALLLFGVNDQAKKATNVSSFKTYLSGYISENPVFSDLLTPVLSLSTLEQIRTYTQTVLNSNFRVR